MTKSIFWKKTIFKIVKIEKNIDFLLSFLKELKYGINLKKLIFFSSVSNKMLSLAKCFLIDFMAPDAITKSPKAPCLITKIFISNYFGKL